MIFEAPTEFFFLGNEHGFNAPPDPLFQRHPDYLRGYREGHATRIHRLQQG